MKKKTSVIPFRDQLIADVAKFGDGALLESTPLSEDGRFRLRLVFNDGLLQLLVRDVQEGTDHVVRLGEREDIEAMCDLYDKVWHDVMSATGRFDVSVEDVLLPLSKRWDLEADLVKAMSDTRKFIAEMDQMRGVDREEYHSVHIGSPREASLTRTNLVALLDALESFRAL